MVDKIRFDAGRRLVRQLNEVWRRYKETIQPHDRELLLSHGLIASSQNSDASSPSEPLSRPDSRAASVSCEYGTEDSEDVKASDTRHSETRDVETSEAANDAPLEAPISPEINQASAGDILVDSSIHYLDYIFGPEDEADYTYGPAKVISATDGFKDCAAILLTMELSAKIQTSLRSKREFRKIEIYVERVRANIFAKDQRLLIVEMKLDRAIEKLEKKLKQSNIDECESLHEQAKNMRNELLNIRSERRQLKDDDQAEVERLEQAMLEHTVHQAEVDDILDDVFTKCKLLEPPEDLASLEAEVPVLLDTRRSSVDQSNPLPSPENAQRPNSAADEVHNPETKEQIQYRLRRNIIERGADLRNAERDFDGREAIYDKCYDAYLAAKKRGEEVPSKSDFDMIQLEFARELTRDLIAAEKAYKEAKVAAREGGVMHDDFQESDFVDDPNDGYRESFEADLVATTDRSRVERWLENVPAVKSKPLWDTTADELEAGLDHLSDADSASGAGGSSDIDPPSGVDGSSELDSPSDPDRPSGTHSPSDVESRSDVDVDEWDARLDSPLYSLSVVAEGSKRRKIDHWRAMVGEVHR